MPIQRVLDATYLAKDNSVETLFIFTNRITKNRY